MERTCTRCHGTFDEQAGFYRSLLGKHGRRSRCKRCCKDDHDDWFFRHRFGISKQQYDRRVTAQGGKCALCGLPPKGGKALAVDHCHKHKHVRALLCLTCNVGLGAFRDDPLLCRKASAYLTQWARAGVKRYVDQVGG